MLQNLSFFSANPPESFMIAHRLNKICPKQNLTNKGEGQKRFNLKTGIKASLGRENQKWQGVIAQTSTTAVNKQVQQTAVIQIGAFDIA